MKRVLMLVVLVIFNVVSRANAIEWVVVADPGNPDDTHFEGFGGVDYVFEMGKYEVSAREYTAFLNAVAGDDPYGLYNTQMAAHTYGCKISRIGAPPNYTYTVPENYADRPVNYVTWGDAARFANWLHNGQPHGAQDATTTEDGAYDLTASQPFHLPGGATLNDHREHWEGMVMALGSVLRKPGARAFLPNLDEWHKAAYYDPATETYYDYPTGTNIKPSNSMSGGGNNACFRVTDGTSAEFTDYGYRRTVVGSFGGSASPYGTFDQGGNVGEWVQAGLGGMHRCLRGGTFNHDHTRMRASSRQYNYPTAEWYTTGFRVARLPVPMCGDGTVDEGAGEECDDGNTIGGDGCSEACADEFCGDGLTQPALGEECDDANSIADDGCDDCRLPHRPPCDSDLDCVALDNDSGGCCAWDRCGGITPNECDPPVPNMFGDVCGGSITSPPNGVVNATDMVCVMSAFGEGNLGNCPNADIVDVVGSDCPSGDGVVTLADVLKLLDTMGPPAAPDAVYHCDCPMNP